MDTKQALRATMHTGLHVLNTYVSDLSDADLMQRPSKGCNHLAWQLGHLIASEVHLLESVCPGKAADLPQGFVEQHSKETRGSDESNQFCSKEEYEALFKQVRQATLTALEELPVENLDLPSPEWIRDHCPTVGHLFTLIGSHPMMHAGQFAVARRELEKPVLI